jgi:hypothetical protein
LFACQTGTAITLSVHTDIESGDGTRVAIFAGADERDLSAPVAPSIAEWGDDGMLGTLAFAPPDGNPEARLALRVVLAQGRSPEGCNPGDLRGCVVSTRNVRYRRHEVLRVPVGLFRACLGVACAEGTTCNSLGKCVSNTLDAATCAEGVDCLIEGDPPSPPGVRRPVLPDAGPEVAPSPATAPGVPVGAYLDVDPRRGTTSGVLQLSPAPGEATVDHYDIAFADGALARQPFRALAGQAVPAKLTLLPGTVVPAGLDFFEIRAVRAGIASAPLRLRADNYPRVFDVAGNAGVDRLSLPELHVDTPKQRTIFVAVDSSAKATARICNLDGVDCRAQAIDAGLGANSSASAVTDQLFTREAHSVFDTAARRLYVASQSSALGHKGLHLITCHVDTWACGHRLVDANTGPEVHPVIDALSKRVLLLETGENRFGFARPRSVWTCGLEPTAPCASLGAVPASFADARAGAGRSPYFLGAAGTKLFGVFGTTQDPTTSKVRVLECTLGAFACTTRTLPGVSTVAPSWFASNVAGRVGLVGRGVSGSIVAYDCDQGLVGCQSKTLAGAADLSSLAVVGASAGTFTVAANPYGGARLFRCTWSSGACSAVTSPLSRLDTGCAEVLPTRLRLCGTELSGALVTASCEVDGSACVVSQVAQDELRIDSAESTDAVIDEAAGRIITLSIDPSRVYRPSLFVCDLLGQNCEHREPAAGDPGAFTDHPQIVLSKGTGPLLLSVRNVATGNARLFVCARDGRNCVYQDLTTGIGDTVRSTFLAIDEGNQKVLVVSLTSDTAYLTRCNIDGNACSHTLLGTGDFDSGFGAPPPIVRVLAASQRLLVASNNGLLLCSMLDKPSCTFRPIPGTPNGQANVVDVDEASGSVLMLRGRFNDAPMLDECPLSDAPCLSRRLLGAPVDGSSQWSAARLDSARQALYFTDVDDRNLRLTRCNRSGLDWICSPLAARPSFAVSAFNWRIPRYSLRLNEADRQLVASFAGPTRRPQVILLDRF